MSTHETDTDFSDDFAQLNEDFDDIDQTLDEILERLSRVEQSGGGGGSGDGSSGGRASDTITVTDYGAVGDGEHDDGPDIQDAFKDAAASSGLSYVYFPAGTYLIEDTVLIPSNVVPCGAGMGNSTILGALNDQPTLEFDSCQNVELKGLTFTQNAEPDNTHSWFFYGRGDNIRFHRCEWRDLPRQGGLFRGSDYLISDCYVQNTGRDGFLFAGVERPTVAFTKFYRTGDDSIAFNVDTTNGIAIGNTVVESGYHHAGGGIKQHGSNCVAIGNVFVRPKTYAIRVQNRDEDPASEGPWPDRIVFMGNVVNGMSPVGGSKNYAIEAKAVNGEVLISNCTINTYDGEGENRRGMRIRATGPETHVHIKDCTISQNPEYNSKYGVVLEEEFEHIEIDGLSLYNTSDAVLKRNASAMAGDCEIKDVYFSPHEEKQLFDCTTDDGFESLRVVRCTSKSPGSALVDCNDAEFGLVQVHDNLARGHDSLTANTSEVDEIVTGPL